MLVLFDTRNQLLFVACALQNARDCTSIPNPVWLLLDANGTFQLQIGSMTSFGETFVLYVAVGIIGQRKMITQAVQQ